MLLSLIFSPHFGLLSYLWEAGKLIYGEGSACVVPWVKEQETLLPEDKVE